MPPFRGTEESFVAGVPVKQRAFSEQDLTEAVLSGLSSCKDERLKRVMASLVVHLHAFVREVELAEAEWFDAVKFLTATGQMCDDKRQEFILLSDTLGVSMLVDAINHRRGGAGTESTVFGPFFVEGAPEVEFGGDIANGLPGERTYVSGRVTSADGKPIAGTLIDVWQVRSDQLYDVQDSRAGGLQARAKLHTDGQGRYAFRTIKPVSYPIPTDGPVGKMLLELARHPYRPAHIHFMLTAPGYEKLVTHIFPAGDPYLDSDAVFGVKDSLVVDFERSESEVDATKLGLRAPFFTVNYNFVLVPA